MVASFPARLEVPASHPMFAGHFPDHPIVPGAWMIAEAMKILNASTEMPFALRHIESIKFQRPVPPGTTLDLALTHKGPDRIDLQIFQGGEVVAEIRFRP